MERYPHLRFLLETAADHTRSRENIFRFPSTLDFLVSWIMFTAFNDGYTPGYDDEDGFFFYGSVLPPGSMSDDAILFGKVKYGRRQMLDIRPGDMLRTGPGIFPVLMVDLHASSLGAYL